MHLLSKACASWGRYHQISVIKHCATSLGHQQNSPLVTKPEQYRHVLKVNLEMKDVISQASFFQP